MTYGKFEVLRCNRMQCTEADADMLCKWNAGSSDSCCFEGEKI